MISSEKNITREFAIQLDEFYLDLQEDGRKISILDNERIAERPFPGLRPFKTSEFQLFRGRDGQAEELIKRLKKNHFLAVIGSSGTGKSSLVRAGLIPQLFGGYLQEAGNKWNIAVCRPGKDPVENLAVALSSIKDQTSDKSHIFENYATIGPLLQGSIYGILEADEVLNADRTAETKQNLLIIIDQFEELFRFDRKDLGKRNIENHFVNLLLKASLNPNSSVYVIITMRSEFLGDCVKYRGLPEAINEGQYLVPQLSRNQIKDVIEGPINLAGKKIAPGLVELLINEIEESKLKENLDQLPILQHALMRTYQEAISHGHATLIEYQHYKRVGEMEKALANHAESKFEELGAKDSTGLSKKQAIAKIIFQALTDASTDQKGGRRPTELKNIYAIARSIQATEKEVDEVINHFRDIDTSFIMPPINPDLVNTGLYPELMLDISHESLMRNWDRLNKWIMEEVRLGRLYRTLDERREMNENDPNELVRGIMLKELLDWKKNNLANVAWASRYHRVNTGEHKDTMHQELFAKNLQFLQKSKLESELEIKKKERRKQLIIWVFAVATIISLSLGVWAMSERANSRRSAISALAAKTEAQEQRDMALKAKAEAQQQRDTAIMYARLAGLQANAAYESEKKAFRYAQDKLKAGVQRAYAIKLANLAKSQSKNLELRVVKNILQKQKFYASNLLEPDFKEDIVNALFISSVPVLEEFPLEKYASNVDMDLLKDVNAAVVARERTLNEPAIGLRMADAVWNHVKNATNHHKKEIIENILMDIFDRNAFYAQEIKPPANEPSTLAVSGNRSLFAVDNFNAITWGTYSNNSLNIGQRFTSKLADDSANSYLSKTVVLALGFKDSSQVRSLQNNGKLMEWSGDTKTEIATLPGVNTAALASFSPDGKRLVVILKEEGSMKVWNLPNTKMAKPELLISDIDESNRFISQVSFSPDGRRIIRLFSTGKMEVWGIADKRKLSQYDTYRHITAAKFSLDGKYLLEASSNYTMGIFDSSGRELNSMYLPSMTKGNSDYSFSRITDFLLRDDWKEMLIFQEGGDLCVAKRLDGDSVVKRTPGSKSRDSNSLSLKKLNGSPGGVKAAAFLDSNKSNLITLSGSGSLNLWNADQSFGTIDEAFKSITRFTAKNFLEKLQAGEINFEEVKRDTNSGNVRNAALYYLGGIYKEDSVERLANINNALFLYKKLLETDLGTLRNEDLDKITSLLERVNNLERVHPKENCRSILQRLQKIVSIREDQRSTDSTNETLTQNLANNYNDLAYYSLFNEAFQNAIAYALKGLEIDRGYNIIYTNLALAYLLSGQDKLAEELYTKFKDQQISTLGISFREGFIQDFDDFTKANIIKPNNPKVESIRKMLSQKK